MIESLLIFPIGVCEKVKNQILYRFGAEELLSNSRILDKNVWYYVSKFLEDDFKFSVYGLWYDTKPDNIIQKQQIQFNDEIVDYISKYLNKKLRYNKDITPIINTLIKQISSKFKIKFEFTNLFDKMNEFIKGGSNNDVYFEYEPFNSFTDTWAEPYSDFIDEIGAVIHTLIFSTIDRELADEFKKTRITAYSIYNQINRKGRKEFDYGRNKLIANRYKKHQIFI